MSELEDLRKEVAELRRELAEVRANQVVHHYHHQAPPVYVAPSPYMPAPYYPGGPYPTTCGQVITDLSMQLRN